MQGSFAALVLIPAAAFLGADGSGTPPAKTAAATGVSGAPASSAAQSKTDPPATAAALATPAAAPLEAPVTPTGLKYVELSPPVSRPFVPPARWRHSAEAITAIIQDPKLMQTTLGVKIASLTRGEVIYAYNDALPLNPASNTKLLTTAAALDRLGPSYAFKTEFSFDAEPERGIAEGPLYIKGFGDPTLVSETLWHLCGELKARGLDEVRGGIIVDDSFFGGPENNPAWGREQNLSKAYLAPYGALSFNHNAVEVNIRPGATPGAKPRVVLDPPSRYFDTQLRATTETRRTFLRVETEKYGSKTRVIVKGRINVDSGPRRVYRKLYHPALSTGHAVAHFLKERGIKVSGEVRMGRVPESARLFYRHRSEPLSEVIYSINKNSNNFAAEQLLKALGAEAYGPPGDWEKGLRAVREFMTGIGVPGEAYVIRNGSGLSEHNRISAAAFLRLLEYMSARPEAYAEFGASLALSGADGTLGTRINGAQSRGKVRAKTGSIDGVTALTGYAVNPNRELIAFSLLLSHKDLSYSESTGVLDAIVRVLTTLPPAPPLDVAQMQP